MFVGFSASTRNLTQIHNIFSWNFTSINKVSLLMPSVETCGSSQSHSSNMEPLSSFLIFIVVMVLALVAFSSLFYGRCKKDWAKAMVFPNKKQRLRPPNKPHRFTFPEVSTATWSFHELEILGSISRGIYYRGKLSNGFQVVVKHFSAQFLNSQPGLDRRRFLKEISAISRVHHPNMVPIIGWCQDNREIMVLYKLYPNGSLDKWLFGVGVLPWTRWCKVVNDIADALSFLHFKHLAHKNMKARNIFLDVSFKATLGDFDFVLSYKEVVDRRIGSMVNLEQAIRVLEIGLLCTLNESKGRLSMEEVVGFLSLEMATPKLPLSRPVTLFTYSSTNGLCTRYSCSPFK
ncbi:hypothetical protein MANES_01G044900v8 [Manihot esculenta]|uniref:Protein kinase domain-containing protein n=1 Tax=Manihot esculenta TaxID=3983 RepID=A0A2C9WKC2_MANES|nr:hypothetical protein MANES_01G044900v8 [Manihot esculenta]